MNKQELLNELLKIHDRYSFERYRATPASQVCTMWSIDDPPDELLATDPLEAVCDLIGIDIDEDYAMNLYDMTLQEAVDSLFNFLTRG
jgi:hypothetical protein